MTDDGADKIAEAITTAGDSIAEAIIKAFGRDEGRDLGFLGEIAMQSGGGVSIARALHRIADHIEGK